ncbi:MAG: hypothetical protein CMI32_00340 [Opitutales bacterium]|nr:hypothetical protein [Opitutales bacterium]
MTNVKDTDQLWSPTLRRPRKRWKNDRDLIEKFSKEVKSDPEIYPKKSKNVVTFLQIVDELRSVGYDKSENTAPLAEWILQEERKREDGDQSSSSSGKTFIEIPMDLGKTLDSLRKSLGLETRRVYPVSAVFRNIDLLEFAKKRSLLLHGTEDVSVYLEGLVQKDQSGLSAPSGTLFDLLESCEQIVGRKGFRVTKQFEVNACDLWVPEMGLAIEPRSDYNLGDEGELFRLLTLSQQHFDTECMAVVLPNEISDKNYQSCRTLQHIIEDLSVLKINEFEAFVEEIALETLAPFSGMDDSS